MKKKKASIFSYIIIAAFIVSLGTVGIISMTDTDPTVSEREQRELARYPQFTLKSFFDGSFFSQWQAAYDDTLPARNFWLDVYGEIRTAATVSEGENGEVLVVVEDEDEQVDINNEDPGEENGEETGEPGETEVIEDMSEEELQELLKQPFDGTGYEQFENGTKVSGVVIRDKRGMQVFNGTMKGAKGYSAVVKQTKSLFPDNRVIAIVAPNSAAFYSDEKYHTKNHDQKAWIDLVEKNLPGIVFPHIYEEIEAHKDEYVYFYTDHHWTTRGAYYAYQQLCQETGMEAQNIEELTEGKITGFLGSLYNKTNSKTLCKNPDTVYYYTPSVTTKATTYGNVTNMSSPHSASIIHKKVSGSNKYYCFTGGDKNFISIKTGSDSGKTAVLIKDSTGNALVPWLCHNYSQIYVIDPRHVNTNKNNQIKLKKFLKDKTDADIIFCSFIYNANNMGGIYYKGILRLLK